MCDVPYVVVVVAVIVVVIAINTCKREPAFCYYYHYHYYYLGMIIISRIMNYSSFYLLAFEEVVNPNIAEVRRY